MKTGKRNILIRFLVPYILLLLVTGFMGLYMYYTALNTVKADALEVNKAVLSQANTLIDQYLQSMEDTIAHMAFNPSLSRCLNMRQPFSSQEFFNLYEAQRSLSLQGLRNDFVSGYYVYLPAGEVVMLHDTTYTRPQLFYSQYISAGSPSYEQWAQATLSGENHKRFRPQVDIRLGSKKQALIPYTFVLQQGARGRVQGSVTALISAEALGGLLANSYVGPDGWYAILNRENEVITASENAPQASELPLDTGDGQGAVWNATHTIGAERMLVTYARSAQGGWLHVTALPYSAVMEKVESIQTSLTVILVVLLALGLAISLVFSYRNSRPVTKLLASALEKSGAGQAGAGKNEFSIIENAMAQAFSSNAYLQKRLDQQLPLLRAGFFDKLCRGAYATAEEIDRALAPLQVGTLPAETLCLVLQFSQGALPPAGKERRSPEMKKVLASELVRESRGGYTVPFESGDAQRMVFLLGFPPGAAQQVYTQIEDAYARLNRVFGHSVMCSVGRICEQLLDVYKSYNDAVRTMEYSENACSEAGLVWFDDIPPGPGGIYYPIEVEQRLMLLVRAGKRSEIKPLLDEVFRENRGVPGLSKQSIRILLQEMQGTLIKLYAHWNLPPRNAIVAFDDLSDLDADTQDRVEAVFEALAALAAKQKKSHNTELERKIIAYIDENYGNSALTLSMVAEAFDISETYLSYFFREQTGSTFSRYLETKRIEHASALLQQGEQTVYKIAEACGYNSAQSFRRAFKRVKNINPTEM